METPTALQSMTEGARAVARARALVAMRQFADAERELLQVLEADPRDRNVLDALADFYASMGRPVPAAQVLARLIELGPREPGHYFALAAAYEQLGRMDDVVEICRRLTAARPDLAVAHFNLACYLRRLGHLEESLTSHRTALELGIERPEEVWSNIAVILGELHRHGEAREALEQALELNRDWIPALYNLALWHEEHGDRAAATELFERVLAIDPHYDDALMRLTHMVTVSSPQDPLIARLERALERPGLAPLVREGLHFALGKAFDDCGDYARAFTHYRTGNEASRKRLRPYDRAATEFLFRRLRERFTAACLGSVEAVSDRPLLFVCGMYRSGSTLLEQMLAAHPAVTSGGELGWFNARLARNDERWPEQVTPELLRAAGKGYLEHLERRFPGAVYVCDKRPDNFLYLGLLKALFPRLRVLHTVRDARDVCLSIYFQQFGNALPYAADLGDIAHYLRAYRGLMQHWRGLMQESILDVDYGRLVTSPELELREVCRFLGLEWCAGMLDFGNAAARVRTASVWQVRQPLYTRSLGRWRHYAGQLGALGDLMTEDADDR
jgi:tetratricopeptide (TPR) repeat protein